jgi:ribosome assembly protein YihI (activator of Der GTPase)
MDIMQAYLQGSKGGSRSNSTNINQPTNEIKQVEPTFGCVKNISIFVNLQERPTPVC